MRRREFIKFLGGAAMAWPLSARAQEPGRTYRLGVLSATRLETPQNTAFLDELSQLGFVQNKNLIVERRGVAVPFERFPQAAREIVESGVDAIFCPSGDASVRAAQAATRKIPIVGIADDMVTAGLVQSLSRPDANTTGMSILATELDGKRQEILMELLPAARHMAALADPATKNEQQIAKLQQAARARGVELSVQEVATVDGIAPASMRRRRRAPRLSTYLRPRCSASIGNPLSSGRERCGCPQSINGRISRRRGSLPPMDLAVLRCGGNWRGWSQRCCAARRRPSFRSSSRPGSN